ncbi:hypothetical protein [Niallia sp. 01092]|uniref:hypothetical protein n=1 Tax=unclassified Niallia TaxID=2837522 RepID=UPI003FD38821
MFLANMAALVKQEADEIIAKKQRGKELKYEYTANQRLLIGKLKDNFIQLMLEKSVRRRNKLYKKILNEIQRNRVPIKPGRSFKRVKGLRANRNGLIQKSAF